MGKSFTLGSHSYVWYGRRMSVVIFDAAQRLWQNTKTHSPISPNLPHPSHTAHPMHSRPWDRQGHPDSNEFETHCRRSAFQLRGRGGWIGEEGRFASNGFVASRNFCYKHNGLRNLVCLCECVCVIFFWREVVSCPINYLQIIAIWPESSHSHPGAVISHISPPHSINIFGINVNNIKVTVALYREHLITFKTSLLYYSSMVMS